LAEISDTLRARVTQRASGLCEYCLSPERIGIEMEVDHIVPRRDGGTNALSNLCLACRGCNQYKGVKQKDVDPATGQETQLFNPREQKWSEHFQWDETGTIIIALTPTGRTTISCLQMNRQKLVEQARPLWIILKIHPPNPLP
jgi:hypothetical protein